MLHERRLPLSFSPNPDRDMTSSLRSLLSMLAKDLRMAIEIVVPTLGELVTEATVGKWFKKPGDAVRADEALAELETDKVTLEVNAPAAGVISEIVVKEGETVAVGAILGSIADGQAAACNS